MEKPGKKMKMCVRGTSVNLLELTRQFWPAARVVVDADDPSLLDAAEALPFVRSYHRNGVATVELENETDVPDLVDALVASGARLTRVEPQAPTREQLYFAIRQEHQ